jgi:hypothetical protein
MKTPMTRVIYNLHSFNIYGIAIVFSWQLTASIKNPNKNKKSHILYCADFFTAFIYRLLFRCYLAGNIKTVFYYI